ncbi:MAG: hypothetical protein ACLPX7_03690 [Xanthobacteraceae bacterium]
MKQQDSFEVNARRNLDIFGGEASHYAATASRSTLQSFPHKRRGANTTRRVGFAFQFNMLERVPRLPISKRADFPHPFTQNQKERRVVA